MNKAAFVIVILLIVFCAVSPWLAVMVGMLGMAALCFSFLTK